LEQAVQDLKKENELLKKDIASRSSSSSEKIKDKSQCSAYAIDGTQCTQQVVPGSSYCSEHRDKSSIDNSSSGTPSQSSGSSGAGQTIYIGPRGGKYYINGNGKKTYIK
jgi:colicin import membrane protein